MRVLTHAHLDELSAHLDDSRQCLPGALSLAREVGPLAVHHVNPPTSYTIEQTPFLLVGACRSRAGSSHRPCHPHPTIIVPYPAPPLTLPRCLDRSGPHPLPAAATPSPTIDRYISPLAPYAPPIPPTPPRCDDDSAGVQSLTLLSRYTPAARPRCTHFPLHLSTSRSC